MIACIIRYHTERRKTPMLIKNAVLKVYSGAAGNVLRDQAQINAHLLEFQSEWYYVAVQPDMWRTVNERGKQEACPCLLRGYRSRASRGIAWDTGTSSCL